MNILIRAAGERANQINDAESETLARIKNPASSSDSDSESALVVKKAKTLSARTQKRARSPSHSSDEEKPDATAPLAKRQRLADEKKPHKNSNPTKDQEEEEEDDDGGEGDIPMQDIAEHVFTVARAKNYSINSINVTLSRVTMARKAPREVITKKLFCQVYELVDTHERQKMARFGLQHDMQDTIDNQPALASHFSADFDFVGLMFPNMTIGVNLDDLMEALYGPVKPSESTMYRRKRSATGGDGNDDEDGDANMPDMGTINVSVCYFKRLSPLIQYTGLDVNRVAPIARSHLPTITVAAQMAGMDDDIDALKSQTTIDRRFLRQNDRVMPIHLVPIFIANQSNSVRGSNAALHVCNDLSRQFEARLIGNTKNPLFVNILRQLRANIHYLIEDTNHRALAGELLINKLYAIDSKYMQLRDRVEQADTVLSSLLNAVSTDKLNILQRLEEGYTQKFVEQIITNKREMPKALAEYAFDKQFDKVKRDKIKQAKKLANVMKTNKDVYTIQEKQRAEAKARESAFVASIGAGKPAMGDESIDKIANSNSNLPVVPIPAKREFKLSANQRITLESDDEDNHDHDQQAVDDRADDTVKPSLMSRLSAIKNTHLKDRVATTTTITTPIVVAKQQKQREFKLAPSQRITLDDDD